MTSFPPPRDPPPAHLRQEIFSLGGRHLGDALNGAKRELLDSRLSVERRRLLQAVVRHLEPQAPPFALPVVPSVGSFLPGRPHTARNWRNIALGGAIIVLAVWAGASLLRLFG